MVPEATTHTDDENSLGSSLAASIDFILNEGIEEETKSKSEKEEQK